MRIVFLYFFAESNSLLNHWGDARRASYVFGKLLMYPVKLAMYHDIDHFQSYSVYESFTWRANWPVFGLVNCKQNSELVNLIPWIAFKFCTNQFHLPKNDYESLILVSKVAWKKGNTNCGLEYFVRTYRT